MNQCKKIFLFLIMLVLVLMTGCFKESHNGSSVEEEKDYSSYFEGKDGTAIFYSNKEQKYYVYNKVLAMKQSSPCSSFKIISCLLGLESGVINPEKSMQKWNGTNYPVKEWNKDNDYIEAFHNSCIWYYRGVLNSIGAKYVQSELDKLEYGNGNIDQWEGNMHNLIFPDQQDLIELNGFWQESSLQISPKEQVCVMEKIFGNKSEFKKENINYLKEVMLIDQSTKNLKLYGKTGSGIKDDTWHDGWFVGMFETKEDTYYFAVRLNQPSMRGNNAKEIAIRIINNEFVD